jgi:protoporphyrinogen oxidase
MAPSGRSSLYVELALRERPNLDQLLPGVFSGLTEMGVIERRSDVAFVRLRHLEHAYVIYDRHHSSALRVIEAFFGSLGIVSTGRYGGWNYSSMEDALDFGEDAARWALELGPS